MVYHERYGEVYSSDPASKPGRMESIYSELYRKFEFIKPKAASENDLKLVHTKAHINSIKEHELIYEIARLAVGGAIKASEIAIAGEPAFGLIRPPGHHASSNYCWGFCFFNNIAISIEKLRREGKIKRALIVDFDLHYGDGTANIFSSKPEISYFHIPGEDREEQLKELSNYLMERRIMTLLLFLLDLIDMLKIGVVCCILTIIGQLEHS